MTNDHDVPAEDGLTPVEGAPNALLRTLPPDPYDGLALLELSDKQTEVLTRPIAPALIDILPTGEVYMSQVHYRNVLREALGPGCWALRPFGPLTMRERILFREWALYIRGRDGKVCYVSQAIGQQEYFEDNDRQTFADAAESVKSNALMRCCKDLGIAAECWDKRFCEEFRRQYCVQVKVRRKRNNQVVIVDQWRLQNADPLPYEIDTTEDAVDAETSAPKVVRRGRTDTQGDVIDATTTSVTKVQLPSDVFQAGNAVGWTTKRLNAFVQKTFGKTVTQLEKGTACADAIDAIREAAASEAVPD